MMVERGIEVDHTALYRWVQHHAPEREKRLRYIWHPSLGLIWRVDETYINIKDHQWKYPYRTIDKRAHTIGFYLFPTQKTQEAKRFLGKTLRG